MALWGHARGDARPDRGHEDRPHHHAPSAEEMLVNVLGKTQLNEELKEVGLELYQIEIESSSPLAGQTLADAELGGGFVIVGIKDAAKPFIGIHRRNSNCKAATCSSSLGIPAPFPSSVVEPRPAPSARIAEWQPERSMLLARRLTP